VSAAQLTDRVRRELAAAGDPSRAPAMQEYMKSDIPYYGVRLPDVRRICRPIFSAHRIDSVGAFDDTVERLFVGATHREERYALSNSPNTRSTARTRLRTEFRCTAD
jgi:hypothetical protein